MTEPNKVATLPVRTVPTTFVTLYSDNLIQLSQNVNRRRAAGWEVCGGVTFGEVAVTDPGATRARMAKVYAIAMQLPRDLWPPVELVAGVWVLPQEGEGQASPKSEYKDPYA